MKKLLPTLLLLLLPAAAQAFCFKEAGQRYAVSPALLWAIAKWESSLNPAARNHKRNGTAECRPDADQLLLAGET